MQYENNSLAAGHRMVLDERKNLSVTGVLEVESFDENTVILHTTGGALSVHGQALHLRALSPDSESVSIDGTIEALIYEQQNSGGGFFARLFG